MTFIFSTRGIYVIYFLMLILSCLFLSLSFVFASRVRRFAGSKKNNPQDEGWEKWNDHIRQVFLNLFFLTLATTSAVTVFNLQRRQQAIFANRDMADKAMATIDDIVNQQSEALKLLYMLDLRLPSTQNDSDGFDIFRNAMVRASSRRQVDFSISDIKKPFSVDDIKTYDRKIYGYLSEYDLASFSALTYTIDDVVDDISRSLNGKVLDYGLYKIDSDQRNQIELYIFQSRSLSAEYVVSLCALYSRIADGAARSDLGEDFFVDVTPDIHLADKLDFAEPSLAAYFEPEIKKLKLLKHKSSDCANYTAQVLREGSQIIPFLRGAN